MKKKNIFTNFLLKKSTTCHRWFSITGLKLQDILVYVFFLQNKLTHAIQPFNSIINSMSYILCRT